MRLPVRKPLRWVVAFFIVSTAHATHQYPIGGVRSVAMIGCVDLFAPSPLDAMLNPAALQTSYFSAEFSLSRLYNLTDFDLGSGAIAVAGARFQAAAGLNQLTGSDYYWERDYFAALSVRVVSDLSLGASVDHYSLEFAGGYRGESAVALGLGSTWKVKPHLAFSAAAANVNRPRFDGSLDPLPLSVCLQASYLITERLRVHFAHKIEEKLPDRISVAQSFALDQRVHLMVGIGTEPTEIGGGASFALGGFTLEYAYRDNVYLGATHRVGLRYSL